MLRPLLRLRRLRRWLKRTRLVQHYEVDRKKKAVEKADAKRNAAKQADEAAKTNAAERLNAEMCQ